MEQAMDQSRLKLMVLKLTNLPRNLFWMRQHSLQLRSIFWLRIWVQVGTILHSVLWSYSESVARGLKLWIEMVGKSKVKHYRPCCKSLNNKKYKKTTTVSMSISTLRQKIFWLKVAQSVTLRLSYSLKRKVSRRITLAWLEKNRHSSSARWLKVVLSISISKTRWKCYRSTHERKEERGRGGIWEKKSRRNWLFISS